MANRQSLSQKRLRYANKCCLTHPIPPHHPTFLLSLFLFLPANKTPNPRKKKKKKRKRKKRNQKVLRTSKTQPTMTMTTTTTHLPYIHTCIQPVNKYLFPLHPVRQSVSSQTVPRQTHPREKK